MENEIKPIEKRYKRICEETWHEEIELDEFEECPRCKSKTIHKLVEIKNDSNQDHNRGCDTGTEQQLTSLDTSEGASSEEGWSLVLGKNLETRSKTEEAQIQDGMTVETDNQDCPSEDLNDLSKEGQCSCGNKYKYIGKDMGYCVKCIDAMAELNKEEVLLVDGN